MKNVKRLACGIAALTALLTQPHAALARFIGTVDGNKPFIVDVRPAPSNTNSTAVTITFIDSRGRSDTEVAAVRVGDVSSFLARSGAISKGTRRIIVEINNPLSGTCLLNITQGDPGGAGGGPLPVVEEAVEGDLRLVFDVV